MTDSTLDDIIDQSSCPRCTSGTIRPVDILPDGRHLQFECVNRQCDFGGAILLPEIKKAIVYLDTSTISHIARARARGEHSIWTELHDALRQAVGAGVICCPGSSIVKDEAEFFELSDEVIRLSRALGDPGTKPEVAIHDRQIHWALKAFLAGSEPANVELDAENAFTGAVNRWLPILTVGAYYPTPGVTLANRRARRQTRTDHILEIYQKYDRDDISYDEMRKHEVKGFGSALIRQGLRAIRIRGGIEDLA